MDYPEHEKMKKVKGEAQVIGDFIEWLTGGGREPHITLCETDEARTFDPYIPLRKNTEQLLAEYFEIDLLQIEKEKQTMLSELRKANT